MYTPGMSVMSLLLKNRYEMKREPRIDFFYRKRKCFCFFSFPKKGFFILGCSFQLNKPELSQSKDDSAQEQTFRVWSRVLPRQAYISFLLQE
jgi:hypothetical protein